MSPSPTRYVEDYNFTATFQQFIIITRVSNLYLYLYLYLYQQNSDISIPTRPIHVLIFIKKIYDYLVYTSSHTSFTVPLHFILPEIKWAQFLLPSREFLDSNLRLNTGNPPRFRDSTLTYVSNSLSQSHFI
jgi:hypothetical protein